VAKAALETRDDRRIILYGERVLARQPGNLPLLGGRRPRAAREHGQRRRGPRLKYARRLEADLSQDRASQAAGGVSAGEWREELDREVGKALCYRAR